MFVETERRTTQWSIDKVKVYRKSSTDELPDSGESPVPTGTIMYPTKRLSPVEASDAWLDSLRDPLQDLFSTPPEKSAISFDKFLMDTEVHTTETIALSDPRCTSDVFWMAKSK